MINMPMPLLIELLARPQYIPQILSALRSADLSKYKDSMRSLIERDMEETEKILIFQFVCAFCLNITIKQT